MNHLAFMGFCALAVLSACKLDEGELVASPEQKSSEYVLPYPIGKTYTCTQGWNSRYSHQGVFSYGVDFSMPIGSTITAARSGRVIYLAEHFSDNDKESGKENILIVMHSDSSFGRYVHLTQNGALVDIGQIVTQGETIALSGNSGQSFAPHLHFDVTKGCELRNCQTIPVFFRNTSPHPNGPVDGNAYTAGPY
ncbi:MAG: M23 family metallopeptidase [Ignavibacteriales bacterium]|nr:M23 family metallopeptidase [Ignavibacteriales bacterium]